jgi:anti-anti-sigma factor
MSPDICQPRSRLSNRCVRPLGEPIGLQAASLRDGSAVIVAVAGEVDAGNQATWSLLVGKMAAAVAAPGPYVVDVRNMTFLNHRAYLVLGQEAQRCRRRGVNLCLVSNQPIVAKTVAATGLRPVLSIYPTVEMAVSRGAAEPFGRSLAVGRR